MIRFTLLAALMVLNLTAWAAPTLTIVTPPNNATISGTVTFRGTTAGAVLVDYSIDNSEFLDAAGTDSWRFVVNVPNLAPGPHTVTIAAEDAQGNTVMQSIQVVR